MRHFSPTFPLAIFLSFFYLTAKLATLKSYTSWTWQTGQRRAETLVYHDDLILSAGMLAHNTQHSSSFATRLSTENLSRPEPRKGRRYTYLLSTTAVVICWHTTSKPDVRSVNVKERSGINPNNGRPIPQNMGIRSPTGYQPTSSG
ncbi:hypothetical protein FRC18_002186 [Serendipita sp. 400]|nr:hypothetical protein FRC18_002186 [Serendipita sp. 400]